MQFEIFLFLNSTGVGFKSALLAPSIILRIIMSVFPPIRVALFIIKTDSAIICLVILGLTFRLSCGRSARIKASHQLQPVRL